MAGELHVFSGTGIAGEVVNRRPGARHALLVLIEGFDFANAQTNAVALAEGCGWTHITFMKGGKAEIQPGDLPEGILRSALETAMETGRSIISYDDELAPNA